MILGTDFETTRRILEEHDRVERPFRTKWRMEILGMRVKVPYVQVDADTLEHLVTLDDEIHRCWVEAARCYTYGSFQASTLLASIVVELVVERYLRSKDLWNDYAKETDDDNQTFGSLITFCKPRKKRGAYLTPTILEKANRLNKLRIEAAHMNKRRNLTIRVPPDEAPLNEIDEIEDVTQVAVDKEGKTVREAYLALDDVGILFNPKENAFYKVRAFRKYAKEAIRLAAEITNLILNLN